MKSVSISGTEEVSNTLRTKANYDGTQLNLEYKWQRASTKNGNYSDINGATDSYYKLKSSDYNKYIKVIVSETLNGETYSVEDITNKIDKSTSSDIDEEMQTNEPQNDLALVASTGGSSANGQFINPSGHPVSGWIKFNNKWYFPDCNGNARVGWINYYGSWYYLSPNADIDQGTMKTGWVYDNGKWYYLSSSGAMVSNVNIDGYNIGEDGVMI